MASSSTFTVLTKVVSMGRCLGVVTFHPTRRLSRAVGCAGAASRRSLAPTSRVWGAARGADRPQYRAYGWGTSRGDDEHPEQGDKQPQQVHFFISPPSPVRWFRKKIGCYVIRTSMDPGFTLDAFLIGAKQAFILVSTYLSQSRYEDLKGLVSEEALAVMCTKYEAMPQSSRRHLAVAMKDIANINPIDIGVWFDDKGGKFASVWIRFLFMSKMLKPGEQVEHVQVLFRRKHQPLGIAGTLDGDRLILVAFYMFQRDFSNENGWIITRTCYSLPE